MSYFGIQAQNLEHLIPRDTCILAAAMLKWAHHDLQRDPQNKWYQSAQAWLEDTYQEHVFSFPNVCFYFGLNQEETKKGLYAGKKYVFEGNKLLRIVEPKRKKSKW